MICKKKLNENNKNFETVCYEGIAKIFASFEKERESASWLQCRPSRTKVMGSIPRLSEVLRCGFFPVLSLP
jgi:hypothetical protein